MRHTLACLAAAGSVHTACAQRLIDGRFDDWSSQTPLAGDAALPASGLSARALAAESRGTELFLRLWLGDAVNLPAGDPADGNQVIEIARIINGSITTVLSWDFRNREVRDQFGLRINQDIVRTVYKPTYASRNVELYLDLAGVGFTQGETVYIAATGVSGWARVTLQEPAVEPVRRSSERPIGTHVRVAAYNTLANGLFDASRQDATRRLIDGVNADIYCLSEEPGASPAAMADLFNQLDPREDGAVWTSEKLNDTHIVSPYPMISISGGAPDAGAVVLTPHGPVAVFSIHPTCCGYTGNPNDQSRVAEAFQLNDQIKDLRSGSLGPALVPYADAPVIVAGDWNLVGSRTPLEILEEEEQADLQAITLPQLVGPSTATWRVENQLTGFFPGRLDLIAASRSGITTLNGYVIDTTRLNTTELSHLGVQSSDSSASDHLVMVADFRLGDFTTFDVNRDGAVDSEDIYAWQDTPVDFDLDGAADNADLDLLIGQIRSDETADAIGDRR